MAAACLTDPNHLATRVYDLEQQLAAVQATLANCACGKSWGEALYVTPALAGLLWALDWVLPPVWLVWAALATVCVLDDVGRLPGAVAAAGGSTIALALVGTASTARPVGWGVDLFVLALWTPALTRRAVHTLSRRVGRPRSPNSNVVSVSLGFFEAPPRWVVSMSGGAGAGLAASGRAAAVAALTSSPRWVLLWYSLALLAAWAPRPWNVVARAGDFDKVSAGVIVLGGLCSALASDSGLWEVALAAPLHALATVIVGRVAARRATSVSLANNDRLKDGRIAQLGPLLRLQRDLRVLDVGGVSATDQHMIPVLEAVAGAPGLRELRLSNNQLRVNSMASIAAHAAAWPALRQLRLNSQRLGDEGVALLNVALPQWPQLVTLDLGDVGMTAVGASSVAEALPACAQLRFLSVRRNKLRDGGFSAVAQAAGSLPELRQLKLGRCSGEAGGARVLARSLAGCPRLEHLDVSHNRVGDEALEALGAALEGCPELQVLGLTVVGMTDEGAEALSASVGFLTRLRTLAIENNDITIEGVRALAPKLAHCAGLKTLLLEDNRIEDAGEARGVLRAGGVTCRVRV